MHLKGKQFLQGNIACAEGAIASGMRFFAGYPITPSTEVAEWLAKRLPEVDGVYQQMEDEIASISAITGARWAGTRSMSATSGPGFSLMMENIGFAAMTETPIVLVNVQRGGPSTGQPTLPASGDILQAMHGSHGDYQVILLSPNSVQEMFELTVEAFNLSERYRAPAILMADEVIGHMRERVHLPEEVEVYEAPLSEKGVNYFQAGESLVPEMQVFGRGYNVHVTGLTHDEKGYPNTNDPEVHTKLVERLSDKITSHTREISQYELMEEDDAEAVIITYGAVSRSAIEAVRRLRDEGKKAGLMRLKTLNPLPVKEIRRLARGARPIMVEMNLGQLSKEVERIARRKVYFSSRIGGELPTPGEIYEFVKGVMKW